MGKLSLWRITKWKEISVKKLVLIIWAVILSLLSVTEAKASYTDTENVIATVLYDSYESGWDTYYYYYVIRDEIRSFSDSFDTDYSHTDTYTYTIGYGSEEIICTEYYVYYYLYPSLLDVCDKNSRITYWCGTDDIFYLKNDLAAICQVMVDRDVTIDGRGYSIRNAGYNMDIFYVTTGNVSISNMVIDGNQKICNVAAGSGVGSGCITNDGGELILSDCSIKRSYNGRHLMLEDDAGGTGIECFSGNTIISQCIISDCDGYGIYVGDWKNPQKCKDSHITVTGTIITDCGGGVGNAYSAKVTCENITVCELKWFGTGLFNSEEGEFTATDPTAFGCRQGIINHGVFHLDGGDFDDNEVAIVQNGKLLLSGEFCAKIYDDRNFIFLLPQKIIEIDNELLGSSLMGAILTYDDDRALGREIFRVKPGLYTDSIKVAERFVPAFDSVADIDERNDEGADETTYLKESEAEVGYLHDKTGCHPAVLRAGAGYDKNKNLYNGKKNTVVLSAEYTAVFDLESNVEGIKLFMKNSTYKFYWMEPLSFPTDRNVHANLSGKDIDQTFKLLGWCLKSDGSGRVYEREEIMSMPNDFIFYPVLDATFALTYHSNFKYPERSILKGSLITSYGEEKNTVSNDIESILLSAIDTSYTVYPIDDREHTENIIRGNTGPDDEYPDYLKRKVNTRVYDINYKVIEKDILYRHLGWSPTASGITYKNAADMDPLSHLYIRDEQGKMMLCGSAKLNKKRCIRQNDRRLFRLRFISEYIKKIGMRYTDDDKYFNVDLYSIWDEAPYLSVKNIEILKSDIDDSLKDMLTERIAAGDDRFLCSDYEDDEKDLTISFPEDLTGRFEMTGDIGSVTVPYEICDRAGSKSICHVKVTVLSGDFPRVLKDHNDEKSGLTRASFYYRFIDKENTDTLLSDSRWKRSRPYVEVLKKALDQEV